MLRELNTIEMETVSGGFQLHIRGNEMEPGINYSGTEYTDPYQTSYQLGDNGYTDSLILTAGAESAMSELPENWDGGANGPSSPIPTDISEPAMDHDDFCDVMQLQFIASGTAAGIMTGTDAGPLIGGAIGGMYWEMVDQHYDCE